MRGKAWKLNGHCFGVLMLLYYALVFPDAVEYMGGLILGVAMIFLTTGKKIKIPQVWIVVIAFAVSYFTLESFLNYSFLRSLAYMSSIILMFIFGYNWGGEMNNVSFNDYAIRAIKIIAYAMGFYIVGCLVYTYASGNVLGTFSRDPVILWNGARGNSTHFSTLSAIPIAISCYGCIIEKGQKRVFNVFVLSAVFICNMFMSNRISIVFASLFMLISLYLSYKNQRLRNRLKIVIIILIGILIAYALLSFNVFGIQNSIMKIPVFERMMILNQSGYQDPRLERQLYVLRNFTKHMNGGGHYNAEIGEVHNVFLDIYDYAGWLPFVIFMIFTVYFCKKCLQVLRFTADDRNLGYFLIIFAAFFASFMEEPVFRSCEAYTVLFFFCCGLFLQYIKKNV